MTRWRLSWTPVVLGLVSSLLVVAPVAATAQAGEPVRIVVLSGRADLLSGGDAYVEVVLPAGTNPGRVTVTLGRRDVTGAFAVRGDGRFTGIVDGLDVGENLLSARLADGRGARLTLRNHPIGGPVFGGPQVRPWLCQTEEQGLGAPRDEQCNGETRYDFLYKSTSGGALQDYDPENPPGDVATTTDGGEEVPFVVRQETGTLDRSIYSVAVLFDPEQPWKPWRPQAGWNHKLHVPFGGSCAPRHRQDPPGSVLLERPLSKGFAVAATGLNTLGQNCNPVISAEALMMTKEHVVETYGEIRYTMGEGCSGGAIQQHNIAATYPGLLDGIMPACTYPDVYTTGMEVLDCKLLNHYFDQVSPHLWTVAQQRAYVTGHQTPTACRAWDDVFDFDASSEPGRDNTFTECGVPDEQMYHAQDNPEGVRCSVVDYAKAVWGERPEAVWSEVEQQLGRGFARLPADNTGVQYGLVALQSGQITAEQFVDLNEKIGGLDIDISHVPERSVADPGSLEIAYRSGQVSHGRQLAQVPIIDLRGTSNNEIHTDYHSYAVRERLVAANGHHDNHVIWTHEKSIAGDPNVSAAAFDLMDAWLAAIEADDSAAPVAAKVVRHRPAAAVDACYINGNRVTDLATCRATYPYYAGPRIAAGGPLSHDVLKCRLKPVDAADYDGALSDAHVERLRAVFPDGACDWTKPGVDQQPSVPWMTYAHGPGGVPLGRPPTSVPFGDSAAICADVPAATEYVDRGAARATHRPGIDCVTAYRISMGSDHDGDWRYQPQARVTRGQMATFILNTLLAAGAGPDLPAGGGDRFGDISGHTHAASINRLARAGVVQGRTAERFAPDRVVTRAQMATFIVAAAEFAAARLADGGHVFADVGASNAHGRSINAGYAAGLFSGTAAPSGGEGGAFSPHAPVRRDQMATFLVGLLRHRAGG
jgi:hypothetical protein